MVQRYPLLISYRKEGENWKLFYLRMLAYILKLKEEYNIDYIPAPSFNPKRVYYDFVNQLAYNNDQSYIDTQVLTYIGETGNEDLIQQTIEEQQLENDPNYITPMNYLLKGLVRGGHLSLLIKYAPNFRPTGLTIRDAIISKNREMIDYIIKLYGASTKEYIFLLQMRDGAVESGDLDLVKQYRYIHDKNYPVQKDCFGHIFIKSGSFEVFKYVLENICNFEDLYESTNYDFIADERIEWVRYFIDFYRNSKFYDKKDFRRILKRMIETAIVYNAKEILVYLKDVRKKI